MWSEEGERTIPALAIRHDIGLEEPRGRALRESDGSRDISGRSDVFCRQDPPCTQKCRQSDFDTDNQQDSENPTCGKFIWVSQSSRYLRAATTGRWTGSEQRPIASS